uniref:Mitochondrial ATP synthase F1 epsilon subunit-like protein 2 n=1 Tax=Karlodinium veneficum TaxID=407301 RepID=F2WQ50_KARVE|nr:mitochondrial ATP synthase F1 epsilon subunit-like protein 2 [Karlodinium veneficum]
MWRAAGVSYLRYSNEMASILRQCLKEPYREAAMKRDVTNITEKVWTNGLITAKTKIEDVKNGFEAAGTEGKK